MEDRFFSDPRGDIKGNTGCTGYWKSCSSEKEKNSKNLLWMFGKIFQKISGVDFKTEISEKPCHWKTPLIIYVMAIRLIGRTSYLMIVYFFLIIYFLLFYCPFSVKKQLIQPNL